MARPHFDDELDEIRNPSSTEQRRARSDVDREIRSDMKFLLISLAVVLGLGGLIFFA
ncbi:hypothetical protein EDF56_106194 [Novosphingobium sp. PhB165]|uniref:hypothetical protein n=1 Tax=Novosphingobium sp. PhB165 TaxID=2485105 RepID=UPI0010DFAC59|nr:hypothetical protein [Novosphingobium sp. PhB165]TCM17081.1 hypothetical protein EDF56_106194 [Novosphingobium sp. PhB165]